MCQSQSLHVIANNKMVILFSGINFILFRFFSHTFEHLNDLVTILYVAYAEIIRSAALSLIHALSVPLVVVGLCSSS